MELSISIHALREEGDITSTAGSLTTSDFNPRPPRGGRHKIILDTLTIAKFQSTPSARRATCDSGLLCFAILDFNPRPPRGERPGGGLKNAFTVFISIHALREEGDLMVVLIIPTFKKFQSTPSARRATRSALLANGIVLISIHALREEGDFV